MNDGITTMGESATATAPHLAPSGAELEVATDRLLVGQGFNANTGEQCGIAVEFESPDDLQPATGVTGQRVQYHFEVLQSVSELRSRLCMSAAASLGLGIFSADARYEYLRSTELTRYETFVYAAVRVRNPAMLLQDIRLTDEARARIGEGFKSFLEYCGTSYVYGLVTGGDLSAIVRMSSTTRQSFERTQAHAHAAMGLFTSGSASFCKAMSKLAESSGAEYKLLRGGSVDAIPDMNALGEYARTFPQRVAPGAHPMLIAALVRGYQTVPSVPSGFIDRALLDRQALAIATLAGHVDRVRDNRANLGFIASNMKLFVDDGTLTSRVASGLRRNGEAAALLDAKAFELTRDPAAELPPEPNLIHVDAERIPEPVAPTTPVLELFQDVGFKGKRLAVSESIANLKAHGFNDKLSSFKLTGKPGQYVVELFVDANYKKRLLQVQSPARVKAMPFFLNDTISSVRILKAH